MGVLTGEGGAAASSPLWEYSKLESEVDVSLSPSEVGSCCKQCGEASTTINVRQGFRNTGSVKCVCTFNCIEKNSASGGFIL